MIRPFAKSDFETYLAMSHEFYNSDATDHQVPEDHFRRTFEESVKGSPLARAWMVIDPDQPDEPVGYLLASITWGNEFGGRVSWLEELYLKEAARGKGLGRQALENAIEELKTKDGVKGFRLEVAPANAAVSDLYRRMGFTKVPYDPWWLVL